MDFIVLESNKLKDFDLFAQAYFYGTGFWFTSSTFLIE